MHSTIAFCGTSQSNKTRLSTFGPSWGSCIPFSFFFFFSFFYLLMWCFMNYEAFNQVLEFITNTKPIEWRIIACECLCTWRIGEVKNQFITLIIVFSYCEFFPLHSHSTASWLKEWTLLLHIIYCHLSAQSQFLFPPKSFTISVRTFISSREN